jgi:hypothetical protein
MKQPDWISVDDEMPPATGNDESNLLLWLSYGACVGAFDGKAFWTRDDYHFIVDPTHWQLIVAP